MATLSSQVDQIDVMNDESVVPEEVIQSPNSNVKGKTKQSKKIPYWLWIGLAKSYGIKINPNDKPILSSVLHLITLISAAVMCFTNLWFCGYDIASFETETDILDGIVRVVIVIQFCGLGVYSHRLGFRIFSHPKFLELMRLHSKTIMKLNSGVLLVAINIGFVIFQNVSAAEFMQPYIKPVPNMMDPQLIYKSHNGTYINPCQKIGIPIIICQTYFLSQMVFSFFFLIWNVVISVVLVSVARTHTIAIRKLIHELDYDAYLRDLEFQKKFTNSGNETLKNYVWSDNDQMAEMMRDIDEGVTMGSPIPNISENVEEGIEDNDVTFDQRRPQVQLRFNGDEDEGIRHRRRRINQFHRLVEDNDEYDNEGFEPKTMTQDEILHRHFKLATQVRFTSMAFQRWMIWIILMVGFWGAIRIVYWLSHSPDVYEVMLFILPLLLLPVLASSYAEVNYEGNKVTQSVMPNEKRILMFRYMSTLPIEMTAFGHKITYGTMGTVIFGIFAAFASKIILQEMNKIIKP